MDIHIDLPDPKYCDGCPCVNHDTEEWPECNKEYWGLLQDEQLKYEESEDHLNSRIVRPQKCIEENGA